MSDMVGAYIAMVIGIVVLAVTNSIPMNALYALLAVVVLGPSAAVARLVRRF